MTTTTTTPHTATRSGLRRATLLAAAACVMGSVGLSLYQPAAAQSNASQSAASNETFEGYTTPSREVSLGFDSLGKVETVNVKPGDRVTAGQELMTLNSDVEQAQLGAAQAEADNAARVQLANDRRDLAKTQLDRVEEMLAEGVSNQRELEQRQQEYRIAETQIVEEEKQGIIAEARVQQANAVIKQKTLLSPVDGLVRRAEYSEGEIYTPQSQTPALELVQLDPLYVEADVPADRVASMQPGTTVQVQYEGQDQWQDATLIFLDPVITRYPQKRMIRLEMPNPDNQPAGRSVQIRLPQN